MAPRQAPLTPTGNSVDVVRARLQNVFRSLNDEVGLQLTIPDPTASPLRRTELAGQNSRHSRCDRIWTELQYQYYQGDIDAALHEFHAKATRKFSGWVQKPRADRTTLPTSAKPYRARDDSEADILQDLLREVLMERRMAVPRRAPRLFKKSYSDGAVLESDAGTRSAASTVSSSAISPARARKKRPSNEGMDDDDSCKKTKNTGKNATWRVSPERASSDLDKVEVRSTFLAHSTTFTSIANPSRIRSAPPHQPQGRSPLAPPRGPSPFKEQTYPSRGSYNASANTSSASLASAETSVSVAFSESDDALINTQTTVEMPSQEPAKRDQLYPSQRQQQQLRPPPMPLPVPPAPPSNIQFSGEEPTSDELQALYDAEGQAATEPPPFAAPVKTMTWDPSSSSPGLEPSPTYSSFPGSVADLLEPPHLVSEMAPEHAAAHPAVPWFPTPEPEQLEPRRRLTLEERLETVWPKFPVWLREAPLAIAWEVSRIALHCGVDLSTIDDIKYDPSWADQKRLRATFYQHAKFRNRSFPEQPSSVAWTAALESFGFRGHNVVLTASLDFNMASTGPLFTLKMFPLKLDVPHRLSRRFGSDRFLEILYPSPDSANTPAALRGEDTRDTANRWLSRGRHRLAGREWTSFYTKDAGYKKPAKHVGLECEPPKAIFKDRTYMFAVDGHNFRKPSSANSLPPKGQAMTARTRLSVHQMLDWLLQIRENMEQPYLKLFSRISLGLSKTYPTVVFEEHQIRAQPQDLLSPRGNVMNDGVGLMSRTVARKVQKILGLTIIPCAIQGRLGSAKGMWIIDVEDASGEDWIETYPSQRKWVCDLREPDHRTLEVRSHASELHSARLNLQFLPVLEDRSPQKAAMRTAVATLLKENLQAELEGLRAALNRPIQHRQWVHENSQNREARISHGEVPFLGGMPDKDEDSMSLMLDHGFDPKEQRYLQDLAWQLQKLKCETLKKKLNISVGRSAYAYMVVDFWGLLEEDEVHICFSNKFQVDDEFADTLLDGIDLLVARSPAHYVSDIQKVRAVFKPALKDLKDVIVFPRKGNVALADKLSGGDYDGDLAWVCWDPAIVSNFSNAPVPNPPDLFEMGYLSKIKDKMADLVTLHGLQDATTEMIQRSFHFNMRQNYLGICTNFKEKVCYKRRNVNDGVAVLLSTLLSNLVDQSKQGIEFSANQFRRLKSDLGEDRELTLPLYKEGNWAGTGEPDHIIDYLKFIVAKPLIDSELGAFHRAISNGKTVRGLNESSSSPSKAGNGDGGAHYFDPHLTVYFDWFSKLESSSVKRLLESLKKEILEVERFWKTTMMSRDTSGEGVNSTGGDADFRRKVLEVHAKWREIQPDKEAHKSLADSKLVGMLEQPYLDPEDTQWALLRASAAFKLLYQRGHKFVWRMAGRQLMRIKSQMAVQESRAGRAGTMPAISVVPGMYVALRPDAKMIKQLVAREDGTASQYSSGGGGEDDDDNDYDSD